MQLGIIGLPQSGKTTLYKALTRADIATDMSTGQMEVHTFVVDVPDPRVDQLCEIYPQEDRACQGHVCRHCFGWQRRPCRSAGSDGQSAGANGRLFARGAAVRERQRPTSRWQHQSPARHSNYGYRVHPQRPGNG